MRRIALLKGKLLQGADRVKDEIEDIDFHERIFIQISPNQIKCSQLVKALEKMKKTYFWKFSPVAQWFRASDMLSEGPGFESRLGHHFSMVLSSLSDSLHYSCSVGDVREMAAPSEMCWSNEKLESSVGKKEKCISVWMIYPSFTACKFFTFLDIAVQYKCLTFRTNFNA